jgi:hypothetical protein
MVRQLASGPAAANRSVFLWVRIRGEDVSRQMPYQPRPAQLQMSSESSAGWLGSVGGD